MRVKARDQFMVLARANAAKSTMRHEVGCVVVSSDGYQYSAGHNRYLGDPEGKGWSLHAEVWAILKAGEHFDGKPRYAFVARSNGRLAKPCSKCMAALRQAGVKKVYYTVTPGNWEEMEIA